MTTICMSTPFGDIYAQLALHEAPLTVANFLAYVRDQAYHDGRVWRTVVTNPDNQPNNSVKIDVIQATVAAEFIKFPAIAMEHTSTTGLRHRDGTISMGRFAPDSAQADFFICIGDQPELDVGGTRNPDGQGFAAFGQVIRGMDVVRMIQRQPQHEQNLTPAIVITSITVIG
jgi:peptidyl-prolyl cis-trans isomerase A (cyclophilin A)